MLSGCKIVPDDMKWEDSFAGGIHMLLQAENKEDIDKLCDVMKKRLISLGIPKRKQLIKKYDSKIAIQVPTADYSLETCQLLTAKGEIEFRIVEAVKVDAAKNESFILSDSVSLSNRDIRGCSVQFGEFGQPYLSIEFTPQGTAKLAELTNKNINKRLAIVFDGKVLQAPVIKEPIARGQAQITGDYSVSEIKNIATLINSGQPPPFKVLESKALDENIWLGNKAEKDVADSFPVRMIKLLLLVLTIGIIYFIPWIVALKRHPNQKGTFFILNLLLGWTLVGWIISLIYALSKFNYERKG